MVAVDPSFCPTCGSELETRRLDERDRAYCPDCDCVVWRNPVPTAGVVVVDGQGDVLLVRREHPPDAGEWAVPAGFLEHDELPDEGAARELREETGVSVDPDALTLLDVDGIQHPSGRRLVRVAYVVPRERTHGDPTPGSDASDAQFWTMSALTASSDVVRAADRDRIQRAREWRERVTFQDTGVPDHGHDRHR